MNLAIKKQMENNQPVLSLSGEIDAYTEPQLKEALLPLTEKKNELVTVDMKNVNYMDSTGLGLFISGLKSAKENESELRLINIQERVLRLFQITGLDEIIDVNSLVGEGEE